MRQNHLYRKRRGTQMQKKKNWKEVSQFPHRQGWQMGKIETNSAVFPLCRVDIRKGLNALKREIPGGDTFMNLGLQRVSLPSDASFIIWRFRSNCEIRFSSYIWQHYLIISPDIVLPHFKANEQIYRENFGKTHLTKKKIKYNKILSHKCVTQTCGHRAVGSPVTHLYVPSRHGQRDHRADRRRAAGAPAHHRAARGRWLLNFSKGIIQKQKKMKRKLECPIKTIPPALQQAERARTLGAIVYCVGVKDFNETQVKPTRLSNKFHLYLLNKHISPFYVTCLVGNKK